MAIVVLVIDVSNQSIVNLNEKTQSAGNPDNAMNKVNDLLSGILGGSYDATMQVTVRDTAPTITTSGTGSTQIDYNFK